jgi:hypothetical protein
MENNSRVENRFNFFMPVNIEKGKNEGSPVRFSGLASDGTRDMDGETMREAIFQMHDRPAVNFNHGRNVEDVIGVLTEWDAKKGYLHVKGEIYPEIPRGKSTIALMKALEKNGRKGLGISIEGKVLERDLMDKSKIKKAHITAVALCLVPKNGSTYANLLKSFQNGEAVYQDPKKLDYEEGYKNLVNFISDNGSELIVKSDGSLDFIVKVTERDRAFCTLVKAYQNEQLTDRQIEDLKNFTKILLL